MVAVLAELKFCVFRSGLLWLTAAEVNSGSKTPNFLESAQFVAAVALSKLYTSLKVSLVIGEAY